jgi:hypothetical protein
VEVVFETEDQRNWTDASFKTYTPPIGQQQVMEFGAGDTVKTGGNRFGKRSSPALSNRKQKSL